MRVQMQIECLTSRAWGVGQGSESVPLEQIHKDIADSVHAMYKETVFNLLEDTFDEHGIDNQTLTGGCVMNSVANGTDCRRSRSKMSKHNPPLVVSGREIGNACEVANGLGLLASRHRS